MLSFLQVAEASRLIDERSDLDRQMLAPSCGLRSLSRSFTDISAEVIEAYRNSLMCRREAINIQLASIGIDPDHADDRAAAAEVEARALALVLG